MSAKDKEKWDKKYACPDHQINPEPGEWLTTNADLLPGKGKALDIAMGEGRNAVYLASLGYDVLGIDISEAAMQNALALAERKNVKIKALAADLDHYKFDDSGFDLILCFNFLDRSLFPEIRKALLPGGLLFFETFNVDYLKYSRFKQEWVLDHNELLREFADFRILRYREVDRDQTAFASLVAQKPNV
ncbi:MAG: class I SAM-dependent methyltransferase [Nitrospinales bacterium]